MYQILTDHKGNIIIKDKFQFLDNPLDGSDISKIDPVFHFSMMEHSKATVKTTVKTTVALAVFLSMQARLPDTTVAYILDTFWRSFSMSTLTTPPLTTGWIRSLMDKIDVQLNEKLKSVI